VDTIFRLCRTFGKTCIFVSQQSVSLSHVLQRSTSRSDLQRFINIHKLLRYNLRQSQITPVDESARAALYIKEYLRGLQLGTGLPATELQPADDLVLLAGNALVNLWHITDDEAHLSTAATILEFASRKSKHSFRIRLMLVRIYRLLGMCFKDCFRFLVTFIPPL
jgi:N-terminal acetyltransferase B complex non-catalytic subunit